MSNQATENVRKKTVQNLLWRFAERCGAQGVSFVVSIVLARLLAPETYGIIALVTVFTNILQVFVDSGLGTALVQNKDADDVDFSSVFYFNIVICLVLYAVSYFCAPYVAQFYDDSQLVSVLRVLSLTLVISGIKNVQQAYVSKTLKFKKFFFATLAGTIFSGVIGIAMAYWGSGVWALVTQQLVNKSIDTIILWFTVKWRPKAVFSWCKLKKNLSFGWKLLIASLIHTVYSDLRQLIIGTVYSSADLAHYNRGKQFPNIIVANINSSIDSVLLPVMSGDQDNKDRLKAMTRRAIRTSSYIMWPLMIGLMAIGKPVISLLLTDKWLPCYPYLCIFCFVKSLEPIHTANLNAIKAMGRSDITLKLEIIKKTVGILIILAAMNVSVLVMGFSSVVYSIFASIVNSAPNKKLLDYSYRDQIKDILPSLIMAAIMGICVYSLNGLYLPMILLLVLQILVGIIIYVGLSLVFKSDDFQYVFGLLRSFLRKKQ